MLRLDLNVGNSSEEAKVSVNATFDRWRKHWQMLAEDWNDPAVNLALQKGWLDHEMVARLQAEGLTDNRDYLTSETVPVNEYADAARKMGAKIEDGQIKFRTFLELDHFKKYCVIKDAMKEPFETFDELPTGVGEDDLFLDTETTGLENFDEIIALGIVDSKGNKIYESLFYPERFVDPGASHVNKLYKDTLVAEPKFGQEWEKIRKLLYDKRVHIYNASFDLRLIKATLDKYGLNTDLEIDVVDEMEHFQTIFGKRLSLQKVTEKLRFSYKEKHTAADDAWLILKCLHELR